jgi:hypothetical protein
MGTFGQDWAENFVRRGALDVPHGITAGYNAYVQMTNAFIGQVGQNLPRSWLTKLIRVGRNFEAALVPLMGKRNRTGGRLHLLRLYSLSEGYWLLLVGRRLSRRSHYQRGLLSWDDVPPPN